MRVVYGTDEDREAAGGGRWDVGPPGPGISGGNCPPERLLRRDLNFRATAMTKAAITKTAPCISSKAASAITAMRILSGRLCWLPAGRARAAAGMRSARREGRR